MGEVCASFSIFPYEKVENRTKICFVGAWEMRVGIQVFSWGMNVSVDFVFRNSHENLYRINFVTSSDSFIPTCLEATIHGFRILFDNHKRKRGGGTVLTRQSAKGHV